MPIRDRIVGWQDQFSPDERQVWCKRSMTLPGYDAAEVKARLYPQIDMIPCWRTCWEVMSLNASGPHGRTPTCLERDAPPPTDGGVPGPSCKQRQVHCSPGCTPPYPGPLRNFAKEWDAHPQRPKLDALGIEGPCGQGG